MDYFYSKATGGFYLSNFHLTEQIPADALAISEADYRSLMSDQVDGKTIGADANGLPFASFKSTAALTPEQIEAGLRKAVQRHADAVAKALGYDGIATAVTYADEPAVPLFEAQGKALRAWRSQVWASCMATLKAVAAGSVAVPSAADLIASLPTFVAPAET